MPKLISIGELIDKSWDSYRDDFLELVSISGWMLLVALLNIIALALNPVASKIASGGNLTGLETTGSLLFFFTNSVVAPIIGLWVFLSLARFVAGRVSGKPLGVREALMEGKKIFWSGALVSVMLTLVIVAAVVVGIGPSVIIGTVATISGNGTLAAIATLLMGLGTIVAVLLGIKWSVEYGLSGYALTVDGLRGRLALKSTRLLVSGRFLSSLVRMIIPNFVFVILGTVAVGIPVYFLMQVLLAASGINLDVQLRFLSIIGSVFPIIAAVLINPIVVIANVLLYRSLKESKGVRLA